MRKVLSIILFLLLISQSVLAYYPVRTVVLKLPATSFTVKPFSTLTVPFTLINEGRTNLTDVVVSVQAPSKYFSNPLITIAGPIPPRGAYNDTLSITVGPAPPGNYTVFITVDSERGHLAIPITVTVKKTFSLKLYLGGTGEYRYPSNVPITFSVLSLSNVNLTCNATLTVYLNDSIYAIRYYSFNLSPGEKWSNALLLRSPPVGKYLGKLVVTTQYGNVTGELFFVVKRRHLNLTVGFRDGVIFVKVREENGYGVGGIKVWINGKAYTTAPDGSVVIPVEKPGEYKVVVDLDGKNVTRLIRVREVHFIAFQKGELLIVKALDDSNSPVSNLLVIASVLQNVSEAITNQSGVAVFNLSALGYGRVTITATSHSFLVEQTSILTKRPASKTKTKSKTSTTSRTLTNKDSSSSTVVLIPSKKGSGGSLSPGVYAVLLLFPISLAGAFYLIGMRPIVSTEVLGRYYFVKVKGPKYRRLKNFKVTKKVVGTEASATKGKVQLKENEVVWVIDELNPGEEAYLKVKLD